MRVFSSGAGVQSIAALVLTAQGQLQYDAHLFCNVGYKAERKSTLRYVADYAIPYAGLHDVPFYVLRATRYGEPEDLWERIQSGRRGFVIPMHLEGSGPMRRQCTADFKIRVVAKWLREHGATKSNQATCGLGISMDEFQRVNNRVDAPHYTKEYPIIDLRLWRSDCERIITDAGLPIPPRSSCSFCPFHSVQEWATLRREEPDDFEAACQLEELINERHGRPGKYLSLSSKVLRLRDLPDQQQLGEEANCESGYCNT